MDTNENCNGIACDRLQRPTSDTCFCKTGFGKYVETEFAGTLRASGGDLGGQREYCDCEYCGTWEIVGALCATDYKWVQNQQIAEGKILPVIVRG